MPSFDGLAASPFAVLATALGLAGAAVGSFIGLASLRLPVDRQIVHGRSRCWQCDRALLPRHLVPVVSFVLLRGRCASCSATIPWRYPAIEIGASLIGLAAALVVPGYGSIMAAMLGWWLLLLALLDAEHFWLPRMLTLPLAMLGLSAGFLAGGAQAIDRPIGAILGYGGLALLSGFYTRIRGRTGIGGGDPILLGAGGAWVGWQGLPWVLVLATWSALGFVALSASWRRWSLASKLPFGSFLAAAIWLVYLARA